MSLYTALAAGGLWAGFLTCLLVKWWYFRR